VDKWEKYYWRSIEVFLLPSVDNLYRMNQSSFSHHMDKTEKSLNLGHETTFGHLSVDLTMSVKDVCDKKMSSFNRTFRRLGAVWVLI